jgi:transposase
MSSAMPALGIDIAKASFEVALVVGERMQRHTFENNPSGFGRLQAWLKQHKVVRVHACLEATGGYGDDLAQYLYEQGHTVSIVNPAVIHHYAITQLARNKTDRLDAQVIARYCLKEQPRPWEPPAPELLKLRQMVTFVETLQEERTRQLNRLSAEPDLSEIQQALQDQLALLDKQIAQFQQAIHDHIDSHLDLRQQHDLLRSIKGIGEVTAAKLISINLLAFDSTRAVGAYAGLSPRVGESGTSVHHQTRLCKLGDGSLRQALYMPAMAARRTNPLIKSFCDRLAKRGKCKMAVLGAAMRKLLCLAYGVLKSGKPFDPNYVANLQLAS